MKMKSNCSSLPFVVLIYCCVSLLIISICLLKIHRSTTSGEVGSKDPRELFYREIVGIYKTRPKGNAADVTLSLLENVLFGVNDRLPPKECTFVIYKPNEKGDVQIEPLIISHHGISALERPLEQSISNTYYSFFWTSSYPNRRFYEVKYFNDVPDNMPMYVRAMNDYKTEMVIIEVHLYKEPRKIDPDYLEKIKKFKFENPDYSSGCGFHFRNDVMTVKKFPNNGKPGEYMQLLPKYPGAGYAYDYIK